MQTLLADGAKLLLHMEEVGDRLAGLMAGYLRWTGMVPVTFDAVMVMEQILSRQMGPPGRNIATAAEAAANRPSCEA